MSSEKFYVGNGSRNRMTKDSTYMELYIHITYLYIHLAQIVLYSKVTVGILDMKS